MAYSEDFRRRAIEYLNEGHTYEELYEAFKIYPSRISEWRKLYESSGTLKPKYKKTRKRKIDLVKLEKAVEKKPDAYLSELAVQFNCTEPAVFYALKKIKNTVKKNNTYGRESNSR
jgi:transposase